MSALVIGQEIVVTSQEGIVMPQGCYKSTATAEAALRQEMALQPQLFLLFLKFSAFSLPLPMASTLPTPPDLHLAAPGTIFHCPDGPGVQVHVPIWHMGVRHWKSEPHGFSATWDLHLWGHNQAQYRKVESMS